jgi:Tfp pilus assembly protein PilV
MSLKRNQSGVSLLEMTLYVGLLAIIVGAVTGLYLASLNSADYSKKIDAARRDMSRIGHEFSQNFGHAASVTSPVNFTTLGTTCAVQNYSGTTTTLTVTSGTMTLQVGAGAALPLTSSTTVVSNFSCHKFNNNAKGGLQISYRTEIQTPSGLRMPVDHSSSEVVE